MSIEPVKPTAIQLAQHPFMQIGTPATITVTTPHGFTGRVRLDFATMEGTASSSYDLVNGKVTIGNVLLPMNITEASWAGVS